MGITKAAVTTARLGIFEPEFLTKRIIDPQKPDDKAILQREEAQT